MIQAFRHPMIRHIAAGLLLPTNRAQHFCALTRVVGRLTSETLGLVEQALRRMLDIDLEA